MKHLVFVLSIIATPVVAQTTPVGERPGRWLSVPRAQAPTIEAPENTAPVLEAPASGPLITSTAPAPQVILGAPEAAPETAVLIAPPPAVPATRPIPRPRSLEVAFAAPTPEVNLLPDPIVDAVLEAIAEPAPVQEAPVAAPIAEPAPEIAQPVPAPVPDPAPIEVAAVLPEPMPTPEPSPRPSPRTSQHPSPSLGADAVADMAQALAAQLAADAQAIATAAPRAVPLAEGLSPSATFDVTPRPVALRPAPTEPQPPEPVSAAPTIAPLVTDVAITAEIVDAAPSPAPAPSLPLAPAVTRVLTPPTAVPVLVAFEGTPTAPDTNAMAAVLLPARARAARPVAPPLIFDAPPRERAPILPRLRPSGPPATDHVAALRAANPAALAAVLLPSIATRPVPVAPLTRSRAPAYDAFPLSALPPSALPEGPYSMGRAIQPPAPFAESNAAVLTGIPPVVLARLPIVSLPDAPTVDPMIDNPDAAQELPAPDPNALARMMEDAMICWRLADLPVEAQWARLSVDVALDETNMPSAGSIRLTGFAHVVSGAAESAYRAAHSALMGCAAATQNAPATAASTLIFDRSGVRLQ